jgi:flagellar protein FlaJ
MTTQTAVKSTIDLLLTAAVFQSWVIGLVAGKMGEGSVARGFIHSLILVMLTVASGYFLNVFIPLSA